MTAATAWADRRLALAGAAVAAYLVYARYAGTQLACTTGGCETVQHSKYAKAAGSRRRARPRGLLASS
jgi:hypothetical protein